MSSSTGPTELDIGVDGGIQHTLDPGKLVAMRRWILCIAIVNFDIDTGPVVDQTYPPAVLDDALKENISFSSFPDASATEFKQEIHSFRVRHTSGGVLETSLAQDGFMYGFAYFMQKRDSSVKRGYLQRSVVILTHLPYPSLFTFAVSRLAPLYFEHGTTMLETACHNIAGWPQPTLGSTIEIGFLGGVYTLAIPQGTDDQQFVETSDFGDSFDPRHHILASIPPLLTIPTTAMSPGSPTFAMTASQAPSVLSLCHPFLPSLWSIWECLILCEPILVFAPNPSLCSVLIWWFRDLIRPVRYAPPWPHFLSMRSCLSLSISGHTSLFMIMISLTLCPESTRNILNLLSRKLQSFRLPSRAWSLALRILSLRAHAVTGRTLLVSVPREL